MTLLYSRILLAIFLSVLFPAVLSLNDQSTRFVNFEHRNDALSHREAPIAHPRRVSQVVIEEGSLFALSVEFRAKLFPNFLH